MIRLTQPITQTTEQTENEIKTETAHLAGRSPTECAVSLFQRRNFYKNETP